MAIWRDHSLTIVMTTIGVATIVFAFVAFDEGRWFDLWLGLGQGLLTASLLFFLSQFFRETTKPEDPAK